MRIFALAVIAVVFVSAGVSPSAQAQPVPSTTQASPPSGVVPNTGTNPRSVPAPHKTTPRSAASGARPPLFKKEGEAQTMCTGDTVVWGNSTTHVYHLAGSPLYGKTKRGGYMCQKAADGGGYHAAKGGA